jgi:hypothetical protein
MPIRMPKEEIKKPVYRKRWYSSNRNWYVLDNPIFGVEVASRSSWSRNWEFCSVSWWNYKDAGWAWVFGIVGLLILFISPLILFLEYKFNLFLLCFLAFWFLTINHAAMRTAYLLLCILCLCWRAISWEKNSIRIEKKVAI